MGFEQKKKTISIISGQGFHFQNTHSVFSSLYAKKKYEKSIHNDNKKKTPIIEQMEIFLI